MISFQFSPVSTMKIVMRELAVVLKLYLEDYPSKSFRSPLKNCFASKAEMKRYKIVRKPKFVIADNDSSTVIIKTLSDFHLLMILKILISLKALRTEKPELSACNVSSSRLMTTMMLSNTLKPSYTYFLQPRPNNLMNISIANTIVKKIFAYSLDF